MKKIILGLVFSGLVSVNVFSQVPEMDRYMQLGFNTGFGSCPEKSGATLGAIDFSFLSSIWICEGMASKLAFFNDVSETSKLLALDLFTLDIGFGTEVVHGLFAGFSPFSINLTQSPSFGVSLMAKYKLNDKIILEGKLVPFSYNKLLDETSIWENNSYLGAHYWLTEKFSFGLRYNRYNYYNNLSMMFSWNFLN